MPASPTENQEEQSASVNEDQKDYENDALKWEEIDIDIGWGTVRGKAIGNGPHHMLGMFHKFMLQLSMLQKHED